jgi:hypothetical protein
MTGAEYLRMLQGLSDSFAHAEPVPKANKSLIEQLNDLAPGAIHEAAVNVSQKIRGQLLADAYGPESEDGVHDREYIWMDILNTLMGKIRQVYVDAKTEPPVFPCVGVLPIGTLDAVALIVPNSEETLIVFNEGVFLFLYILAKVATIAASSPGTKGSKGQWTVQIPDECRERFRDLFLNYILHGKPNRAGQWFLEPRFLTTLQDVTTAAELFLLAHELKHVRAGDLTNKAPFPGFEFLGERLQPAMTSYMQERLADAEAAVMTMSAMAKETNIFIIYNGIELAICAHQLVENAHKLFKGEAIPSLSILENSRSFELNRAITRNLGESTIPVIHSAALTRTIFQDLWDDIVPRLIALRENGSRLATVWSPAL